MRCSGPGFFDTGNVEVVSKPSPETWSSENGKEAVVNLSGQIGSKMRTRQLENKDEPGGRAC